jgi:hypothetical protein
MACLGLVFLQLGIGPGRRHGCGGVIVGGSCERRGLVWERTSGEVRLSSKEMTPAECDAYDSLEETCVAPRVVVGEGRGGVVGDEINRVVNLKSCSW